MQLRDKFVHRMTEEQETQGMSDAGLAKRVSDYYPMSAATVWKLKNSDRGLSIDEALAIVYVFDFETVEDFLNSSPVAGWVEGKLYRASNMLLDWEENLPLHEVWEALDEATLFLEDRYVNSTDGAAIQEALDDLLYRIDKVRKEVVRDTKSTMGGVERFRETLRSKCPDLPEGEFSTDSAYAEELRATPRMAAKSIKHDDDGEGGEQ